MQTASLRPSAQLFWGYPLKLSDYINFGVVVLLLSVVYLLETSRVTDFYVPQPRQNPIKASLVRSRRPSQGSTYSHLTSFGNDDFVGKFFLWRYHISPLLTWFTTPTKRELSHPSIWNRNHRWTRGVVEGGAPPSGGWNQHPPRELKYTPPPLGWTWHPLLFCSWANFSKW